MIPLFHDFHGRRVVIFGGGSVAARKARLFGREAQVVVVAKSFHDRLEDCPCERIRADIDAPLVESLVADAALVIPATDDERLNARIEEIARSAHCLVNSVDHAGRTITPSIVDRSNLTVAISTGGRSPAVSKYLGQRLEPEIERADAMVDLQATLRSELGESDEDSRREVLWAVLEDDRVWDALAAGERERAGALAREHR